MKSDQTIIRKNPMEQLHLITKLLDIKDPNIQIIDIINRDNHKEIISKLDYEAPPCPNCRSQMKKVTNLRKISQDTSLLRLQLIKMVM